MSIASILSKKNSKESVVLIVSIFIAGLCSIIYELLISTTSSYFLGDSVKQFSVTIGIYMASMGVGSYISRFFEKNLLSKFIALEIMLGFIGGISVPCLYLAFAFTDSYYYFMFSFIVAIGVLIGMEIPFLTRLMQEYYTLKVNISNILSLDYMGALIATMMFPFLLLPFVGVFKSSLVFGLVNMIIGFINLWGFSSQLNIRRKTIYYIACSLSCLFLILLIFFSQVLLKEWNNGVYEDRVVYAKRSSYQNIVLTKNKNDIRLFLNGGLQYSSIDEYRYHETLVHVPLGTSGSYKRVLILGGGDGLAVREILKHKNIEDIVLVDLDPEVVRLANNNPLVLKLNKGSLKNSKVKVFNEDAFVFLKNNRTKFDVIIADLPDPSNISLARLYSLEFYKLVEKNLDNKGVFLSQATSPFFAKKTFWSIGKTIKESGMRNIYPLHVNVPSFAEWGFVLASKVGIEVNNIKINTKTKFLESRSIAKLFNFDKDLVDKDVNISTLNHPYVLDYYLSEWEYWN